MKKGSAIILQPLERQDQQAKRIKNKWATNVNYLQDLRQFRAVLIEDIQNGILTLHEERRLLGELPQIPESTVRASRNTGVTPILNSIKVTNSQVKKTALSSNEDLSRKFEEIDKCIETPVLMLGMTGYQDYRELAQSLFNILALLEIEAQSYVEVDQALLSQLKEEKENIEEDGQKSKAIDRLKSYVQLLKDVRVKDLQHQQVIQSLQEQLASSKKTAKELASRLPKGPDNEKNLVENLEKADLSEPASWSIFSDLLPPSARTALKKQTEAATKNKKAKDSADAQEKKNREKEQETRAKADQELRDTIEQLEAKVEFLTFELQKAKEGEQSALNDETTRTNELQQLKDELAQERRDSAEELKALRKKNEELQEKIKAAKVKSQAEIKELQGTVSRIAMAKEDQSIISQLRVKEDGLNEQLERATAEVERLTTEVEDLEADKDSLKEQFQEAYKAQMSLQGEVDTMKREAAKQAVQIQTQSTIFKDISEKYMRLKEAATSEDKADITQLKEEAALLKDKLETKITSCNQLELSLEQEKERASDFKSELAVADARIEALQDTIRDFTSGKNMAYDDTFEAVLRNEFQRMRVNYEEQVRRLKEAVDEEKRKTLIERSEREKEVSALQVTKETLSSRVFQMRLKLEEKDAAEKASLGL